VSATSLRDLRSKAKKLSESLPYLLEINKEPRKDVCWVIRNNGMKGSDVIFAGSASECESYLMGMEEALRALFTY